MKRAFRYDGKELDKEIVNYNPFDSKALNYMKQYQNCSVTENGAIGYKTTTHPLVDLNFMVSSLRNCSNKVITNHFIKAYYESPKYAVKWLFFLRDILEGLGERRSFRVCMKYLANSHIEIAKAVMELIPEYGRYDDLLVFLETDLEDAVCKFMKKQLEKDICAKKQGNPISLLAKWLPSINTSSEKTKRNANILVHKFGMTPREYRKTLSELRSYSNVVEVKLSAQKWSEVEYEKVPAKANLKYENTFKRHDEERYVQYLLEVLTGNAQLTAKGIMPYELVHRLMMNRIYFKSGTIKDNLFIELMWKKLVEQGFQNDWGFDDCIVVADGSGSMYTAVSGSKEIMAIEVCNSLAIYFAEQLKGVFHNKAITFSATPQLIDLELGKNLKEKLEIMLSHCEVSSTNIEAVFDMLLDMAISNEVPKEEIPKQVLIISDMEFDMASSPSYLYGNRKEKWNKFTPTLFETIEKRYEEAGYKMPKLIFWNVCGRTNTIPKIDNEQGLCLLSGFSQNAMKIATNTEQKDPYESLIQVLDGERYEKVEQALIGLIA